ncbi:transcription factor LRL2-like isoform X2 [Cucumis melo]|uniref:Transcription factor LRL2-like isoform X2 n=1 Tax=Cucumis melo TaxID=3656 RepID=A0A1S3BN01_CUCME|nr:transcription factor LRL2-like isoform X2 [Cucumis melo]
MKLDSNVKMEGQNGCNNSVRMLSLNFGANVNIVSQARRDFTNHHHVLPADRNVNQTNIPHLTEWTQAAKTSPAFVEFIADTSNFSRETSTKDVIAVVPSTVQTINGVSELRSKISYNHLAGSYNSKPTDSRNNARGTLSKSRPSSSSKRGYSADRQRKMRIAERLEALLELLPPSKENQASALDDAIDHIKYLQLRIKDLSQSKLGGELSSEPFIFVEGYGHYMNHQEMQISEPLEEMVGKLMEVDPLAAAQLLENKGLFVMPMDFVEGLC